MPKMTFADRLRSGETIYTLWSMVGSPPLVGQLALSNFDAIVVDMQHSSHSDDTVVGAAEAIITAGKIAITRLPVDRFDAASRALDLGYEAVIAPMINSKEDAEKFAEFMKYPPLGQRSWGPVRAVQLHGMSNEEMFESANEKTLAFAMIETVAAYEAFDEIISVDGIDGIFVGPSDLSVSFSNGAGVNAAYEPMQKALEEMPQRAKEKGKLSGIFGSVDVAERYANFGYNFINVGTDMRLIKGAADEMADQVGVQREKSRPAGY